MIHAERDADGVREALEALFEESFVRARIQREAAGASAETRERMEWQLPKRKLSPGYYRWAEHLLLLDEQRRAGVGFTACELAHFEASGLVQLELARAEFKSRHPSCGACGERQENRFSPQCCACGVRFRRKGS